ncbi:MAG: hypothetical protein ABSA11_09440 [Candidatus Bathyarchaeia archaeon]|jgi:hypothetical protein
MKPKKYSDEENKIRQRERVAIGYYKRQLKKYNVQFAETDSLEKLKAIYLLFCEKRDQLQGDSLHEAMKRVEPMRIW